MEKVDRALVTIIAADPEVRSSAVALLEAAGHRVADGGAPGEAIHPESSEVVPLAVLEQQAIDNALRITGGRVAKAARLLGIGRATLYRRLAERAAPPTPTPSSAEERPSSFH